MNLHKNKSVGSGNGIYVTEHRDGSSLLHDVWDLSMESSNGWGLGMLLHSCLTPELGTRRLGSGGAVGWSTCMWLLTWILTAWQLGSPKEASLTEGC